MNYLRIKNNEIVYPYTIEDLKADHRNVTFPATLSEQTMIEFDLYEVRQTPKPNDYTKNISEGTPILIDGVYYQNWEMEDASQSEIDLRIETKWIEIKDIRNELLQECDWTQLNDIPSETKSIWTTYRQELRDITNQTNPFNIVWPVKP